MIQVVILTILLGICHSASLDHLYLPPNQGSPSSPKTTYLPSLQSSGSSSAATFNGYSSAQSYSANELNQIPILKFAADNNGDGTYSFNYETGNKINAEEQGDARGDGTKARGSFSYISDNGEEVSVAYTADENGFVPQGSHIPTPPPVPQAILKALEENAAAEARGVFDDGSYHGEGLNEGQYQHQEGSASNIGIQIQRNNPAGAGGYAYNGGYKY